MHKPSPEKPLEPQPFVALDPPPNPDNRVSGVSVLLTFQCGCHIIFTLLGLLTFFFTVSSWTDLGTKDIFVEDYLK